MTQTATSEKTEALQPTEGAEMLERFWSDVRAEVDLINIVRERRLVSTTGWSNELLLV